MNASMRRLLSIGVTVVTVAGAATLVAQNRTDVADGSLAGLTSELRQLRVAVETLTRSQAQTQALGVYLSVQQGRVTQVAARLETVQKELDAATLKSQEIEEQLENFTTELSRVTEPARLAAMEDAVRTFKNEQRRVGIELQQLRNRESQLSGALQLEESRWNDLITRLEQAMR